MEIKNKTESHSLVFDSGIVLAHNSMLLKRPSLFKEWDFEENNNLELNIYEIKQGSVLKVNWICSKCKSKFQSRVDSRTRGGNCPYCTGQKVNHTNSLATLNTDLSAQWHPTKNGDLTPHQVPCKTERKVWWICENGHPYESRVSERSKGKGCAYCFNKKVLVGFNDIWTTHPHVASLLLNPEDGYECTFGSKKKANFLCPSCKTIVKNKTISHVSKRGLSCQACADGYSIPEKIMYSLLSQLNVNFDFQKIFDWAVDKRYDFYLLDHNIIIETHGKQHSEEGFAIEGSKSFSEVIENDKYKKQAALKNQIDSYIEIDCYKSEIDYIKSSIEKSTISTLFDMKLVDWDKISLDITKSIAIEVCKYFNSNNKSIKEIAEEFKISDSTVRDYLTRGATLGMCDYKANSKRGRIMSAQHSQRPVVQLSKEDVYISEFESISQAGKSLEKASYSSISACCLGKSKTAYGFKWMYKDDYDKNKKVI